VTGEPFSMMRTSAAELSDGTMEPGVRRRLEDLDKALKAGGWERMPDRGEHWWSLRYTRA
jgi:hypothetical protein